MVKFIRLFRGYVRIRIAGPVPQRFLNLCSVHDISLWNIVAGDGAYEMNVSVADFFRLKPMAIKTKTKVVLLEKRGLPFHMQKWKKRKVFIGGFLFCVLGIYLVSMFLWDIRLVNEGRLTQEMLLSFLQDQGVGYGSLKREVDIDRVEKALRDEYPFIIWTSCKMEGTRLFVYVKENEQSVEERPVQNEPCNLLATVSGNVVSIITRNGVPKVKPGDEVKKGDVMVGGEVPVYNDDETIKEYMYVRSDADVRLETELKYHKTLKLDYQKKVYTGQEKAAYYVRVYKNSFSSAKIPDYEQYDIVTDLKQGKLLNDFYLPIYYGKIKYQEYRYDDFVYTQSEGEALLNYEFEKFCETLQQKGVQIVEKNVKIEKNGRTLRARGKILVEMSDGEPEIISEMKQTGEKNIE